MILHALSLLLSPSSLPLSSTAPCTVLIIFIQLDTKATTGRGGRKWAGLPWVDSLLKLHKPVGSWTTWQGRGGGEAGMGRRREESCWSVANAADTQ